MISKIGLKNHWAVADYLQRSARHIASKTDLDQAYAVGKYAVQLALNGKTGVMSTIRRVSDQPYKWTVSEASLKNIANVEKKLPNGFISNDGYRITNAGRRYLRPLIQGEASIKYLKGIPDIARLKEVLVQKKLRTF